MKRELDGFVMNRMQGALLEEAFRLVAEGYASVEDVDIGIREGLALRWSFMGPFETIDLNAPGGVRDYVERYQGIYAKHLPARCSGASTGPGLSSTMVEAERRAKLPARTAWRAADVARPPADGAGGAQAKRGQGYRHMRRYKSRRHGTWRSGQGHHHLRGDGRDPHADHVALSAGHAGPDRRRSDRRGGGRRGDPTSARARSRDRQA